MSVGVRFYANEEDMKVPTLKFYFPGGTFKTVVFGGRIRGMRSTDRRRPADVMWADSNNSAGWFDREMSKEEFDKILHYIDTDVMSTLNYDVDYEKIRQNLLDRFVQQKRI